MQKIKTDFSQDGSVFTITLDDGKGNILDHVMMEELSGVLKELSKKEGIKLIIFQGAGKHFSFGASVEEHVKDAAPAMLRSFHGLFLLLRDLSIPTLAQVSGNCLGGGMELAIMCNFIFADNTARFGQPEIVLGVFPPPASIILPEKIGLARAEEILITGRVFGAEEALQIGLLNGKSEDKIALEKDVNDWVAKNILPKSASSLRYVVKSSRVKFNHVLGNFLPVLENLYISGLMETSDANEGINSFIEKRSPIWKHN